MSCNCNSCLVTKAASRLHDVGIASHGEAYEKLKIVTGEYWGDVDKFSQAQIDTLTLLAGPHTYAVYKMILARKGKSNDYEPRMD